MSNLPALSDLPIVPVVIEPPTFPRKTIYTLNVDNYEPRIRELTYPLMAAFAKKIGAETVEITGRNRPDWPITIEKFQVAEASVQRGDDWSIFIDADTLISPEMFDPTEHMSMDTVAHNGKDMSGIRWGYDKYFRRDSRHIGSCTWFVIASRWCVEDLWAFPQDDLETTLSKINITIQERASGHCKTEHLIDDYTLSRNIARFGLKFDTITDICGRLGYKNPDGRAFNPYLWHKYTMGTDQKVLEMLGILATPNGQPAFPIGVKGEIITVGNGIPVLKTSIPTLYGPEGSMIGSIGQGWGQMSREDVMDFCRRWNMGV